MTMPPILPPFGRASYPNMSKEFRATVTLCHCVLKYLIYEALFLFRTTYVDSFALPAIDIQL